MKLVGVVEEEERPEHGAFPDPLRSFEVDVPVKPDLGVRDVRAVDEDDSVEKSHGVFSPGWEVGQAAGASSPEGASL